MFQKIRRPRVWGAAFAAICATAVSLFALQPQAGAADASDFSFTYLGPPTHGASTTTYSWRLDGPSGESASHVIIQTCFKENVVATTPPGGAYSSSTNPGSTLVGWKWDGAQAVGTVYTITVNGLLDDSGTAFTNIKKGSANDPQANKNQETPGPSCTSLTVVKEADPADGTDFDFTSPQLGDFTLDVDGNPTHSDSKFFDIKLGEEGTYSVEEEVPDGWDLVSAHCVQEVVAEAFGGAVVTNPVEVDIEYGENWTCTFTNVKQDEPPPDPETGDLTIVKEVTGLPASIQADDYEFTFKVSCNDGTEETVKIQGEGSATLEDLPVGCTCVITEDPVDEGEGVTWTTTVADDSGDADDGEVVIDADGETVTFTNDRAEVQGEQKTPPAPQPAPPAPAPPAPAPQVLGEQQQLPRTGAGTDALVAAAATLLLLGMYAFHGQRKLARAPKD